MARFATQYPNSVAHQYVNRLHAREWVDGMRTVGIVGAIDVKLDLRPLASALRDLGTETKNNQIIARSINRGLNKFKSSAHDLLKTYTKIRRPSRLKKGVRLIYASAKSDAIEGRYIIKDRNIRITREYFGAQYRPYGTPGANARWGRPFSPAGATWTSWDSTRTGKSTFMMPGKAPVMIRLRKMGKDALRPVWGPNPAQIIRLNRPAFVRVLTLSAQAELHRQIALAYRKAEGTVKARNGL